MSPSQRADRTQNALASPPMAELAKQDQPIQTSEHQYPTVWSLYGASKTDDVSNQLHNADSFQPSTPSNPPIPMNTSTSVSHTPSATASERLAKINDQVNRILAPVHALEALKFTEAGVDSYISNPSPVTSITPQAFSPQMPNTDPTPIRAGGRRGRGPRRRGSQLASGTITLASAATGTPVTPTSVRGRGQGRSRARASRGGRGKGSGRNGKRRRSDAEGGTSDSEASENFTPLEQSRSGRKIIHTAPLTPVIKIEDDETKGSPLSGKTSGSAGGRGSGKKRVASRKTPGGAGAVCKNCGRGHSPISNAIVFCDGCNTPWHQFCHTPPIGKDIVLIEEKAWYCSDCVVMKEERSRLQGKVAGQNLSMLEKRRYLQSLPSKELVSLLLHACSLHPDLPVFNQATNGDGSAGMAEEYYDDEDLLPYPKAGHGVMLRPERERLGMLLDDDKEVFSHTTSVLEIARMIGVPTAESFISQKITRSVDVAA